MNIKSILRLLFKKDKLQSPAKITATNIKSVMESTVSKFKEEYGFLPKWEQDQVVWRIGESKSKCISQGYCSRCGCDTPELQRAKKACEGGCYPEWIPTEREWNLYVKQNKINV